MPRNQRLPPVNLQLLESPACEKPTKYQTNIVRAFRSVSLELSQLMRESLDRTSTVEGDTKTYLKLVDQPTMLDCLRCKVKGLGLIAFSKKRSAFTWPQTIVTSGN